MSHAGRCLCGACRFTAQAAAEAGVCHCSICRKWTGGINMAVSCTDVTWNEDAPLTAYRSSLWAERVFCAQCGSNLFWRAVDGAETDQVIALMAFDTPEDFPVTTQIYIDEKPDSYALAHVPTSLTGAEAMARFAPGAEAGA